MINLHYQIICWFNRNIFHVGDFSWKNFDNKKIVFPEIILINSTVVFQIECVFILDFSTVSFFVINCSPDDDATEKYEKKSNNKIFWKFIFRAVEIQLSSLKLQSRWWIIFCFLFTTKKVVFLLCLWKLFLIFKFDFSKKKKNVHQGWRKCRLDN